MFFEQVICKFDSSSDDLVEFCRKYPHLDDCIHDIIEKNSQNDQIYYKWHQLDIIKHKYFSILDPISGKKINSFDSIILSDKTTFFKFSEQPDVLICSANLGAGFPLCAVIILSIKTAFNFGDPVWGVTTTKCNEMLNIYNKLQEVPVVLDGPEIYLVSGDPNFAHNAWNQLGFFDFISDLPEANQDLTIISTHMPVARLIDLFPRFPNWREIYHPDSMLSDLNSKNRVFVPVGSQHITKKLQNRIIEFSNLSHSSVAERIRHNLVADAPVLWFSVRTINRTAVNQIEFISSIIQDMFDEYGDCNIIIDGHSKQFDFEENPSYDKIQTEKTIESDNCQAIKIIENVEKKYKKSMNQRIFFAIGLSIVDSIFLSQFSNFYCCHHGTVQHKIGWFSNKPGVVHANTTITQRNPAIWVANQIDGGIVPDYLPLEFIKNVNNDNQNNSDILNNLAHNMYEIQKISDVSRFVLSKFERSMSNELHDKPREPRKYMSEMTSEITVMPFHGGINYLDCLSRLHEILEPERYLEIGVHKGDSLARAQAASIAIDPDFQRPEFNVLANKPTCYFFRCESDRFFAKHDPVTVLGGPVDLAFLDGMHWFEFLLRDFANTERSCRQRSVIVLHDCLPIDPRITNRDAAEYLRQDAVQPGAWAGDVWKLPVLLKRHRPDLTMVALDAPPTGLILIARLDPASRSLNERYEEMIQSMMTVDLAEFGTDRLFELLAPHPTSLLDDPAALRAALFGD